MTAAEKLAILKNHSIPCITNIQKTQILAEDIWVDTKNKKSGSNWIDVTEWSNKQVHDWLGY